MPQGFVRTHAFLLAAAALPVVVALLFMVATAIPRWTVPPPAYDLVLRAARPYADGPPALQVEYSVTAGGRVQATVRPAPPQTYGPRWDLLLFDHRSMTVREVPLDVPEALEEGEVRTFPVQALATSRVTPTTRAPDGYTLEHAFRRGSGLVTGIFGMNRGRTSATLTKDGRAIPLDLPPPYGSSYVTEVSAVGWIVDEERR